MKKCPVIFLLLIFIVFGFGCQGNFNTSPISPGMVQTPTPNSVPPMGIYWKWADVQHIKDVDVSGTVTRNRFEADIAFSVNHLAEPSAGVTLTGPGFTIPLPYSGTVSCFNSSVTYTYAEFNAFGITWPYQPGGVYVLTVNTSIGVASSAVTAPGGIVISKDGLNANWTVEGDTGGIGVNSPSSVCTYSDSGNLISPFSIPVSAYSAGSGNYVVTTSCSQTTTNIVNGSGSYFGYFALDTLNSTIYK